MLAPEERVLLVDLLAPPEPGFVLDHAVVTTFSLDLTALLPVPLAFAGWDLRHDAASVEPFGVMRSVRAYADRIDLFCQAGQVFVPTQHNPLLELLADMVHPVGAPPGGLFHPKVWLLRYRNAATVATADDTYRFRLVCGSRNLTHDRAWDAVVALDGRPVGRQRKALNRPLSDFVHTLPTLARDLPEGRKGRIEDLAESVRTVHWERPEGLEAAGSDWLEFHPLGRARGRNPMPAFHGRRHAVISPFLNDQGLNRVIPVDRTEAHIVSRSDQLDGLSGEMGAWIKESGTRLHVLDDVASLADEDSTESGPRWSLSGLHAKVTVVERDHRAHLFIGSANATQAAYESNDEFVVRLTGSARACGVASLFDEDQGTLRSLLLPYEPGDRPLEDPARELERDLRNILRGLAALPFRAQACPSAEESWTERITCPGDLAPALERLAELDATLHVGLLTVPGSAVRMDDGDALVVEVNVPGVEQLTPYLRLSLRASSDGGDVEVDTVVVAHLDGDPADRMDRLIAGLFKSPGDFLRFLVWLLGVTGESGMAQLEGAPGLAPAGAVESLGSSGDRGVLEMLAEALASDPRLIDEIGRTVQHLTQTPEGRAVLPTGWQELWPAVSEARRVLGEPR